MRRIWNGMIDKRPAAIARCTGPAGVMAAVRFARERRLPIAVRCGGHNVAGNSVCDVVTADGASITADGGNHSDLLWALKGGGGNFGVVTSFEFRLHPVGPEVWFLLTFYPAVKARNVLKFFRSFMPEAPDELMAIAIYWNAPEGEPIPAEHQGSPVMVVVGCWCGPVDEASASLDR